MPFALASVFCARVSIVAAVERGHVARGYDFKAKVDDTIAENV